MKTKIRLKGTGWDKNQMEFFKTFEAFYTWAEPIFEGTKKDFEEEYYKFHTKPKAKE